MGLKRGRGTDKVDGSKLYRKTLGSPQLTPQKFRRQLKVVTLRQGVQADYSFPTTLADDRTYVDLNQNDQQYEGATLTTTDEILLQGNDLISYKRTQDAQTETLNERLVNETDPPPQLSALVTTMSQEAIGNGKSLLTYGVVPSVFPNQRWEANRATLIPAEFGFLVPEASYTFTEAGIAAPIPLPLPPGTTSASDEQIDVYRHRLKTGVQDFFAPGILPITITGSRTTKDKQVEQIEKTLQLSSVTPAPPTSVLDVTWQNLGNGAAIEEHDFVDTLFTAPTFEKELVDVTPHKFKSLLPVKIESSLIEGTAAEPTLVSGDLKRTSEQVNVFVVKNTRQYRDVTVLPVQILEYKLTGKLQIATSTVRLAVGLQTLSPDELSIDGSVEDLGNNTSLKIDDRVTSLFAERSYEVQIPDLIPEKFRPVVPTRHESVNSPGTAAAPNLVPGELAHTSEQVNAFVVRDTSTFRDTTVLPQQQISRELSRNKQIVTVTTILDTGLQAIIPIDELTEDAKVDNLGNNLSLKTVGVVGALFTAESFGKQIPDVLPEKFRVAVPTSRHEFLQADTSADDRALASGELSYTSERVNAFVTKETSTGRTSVTLPVHLNSRRMTAQQQVALTVATLDTGLQTITPDELTVESEVDNLGNNTSLKTESTVPNVFVEGTYSKSILNLIPEKLRAAIPIIESSEVSAGNASTNPTLLSGEFERTEKQLTVYKMRADIKKLGAITLPVTATDHGFTEQNGGDTTTTTHTLNTHDSIPVEVDQFVLKSEVIDLGNGYDVRSTERADHTPWPTLNGQDYDERLDVVLPYTTKTTAANSDLGTARTEIKPRDQWKQDERTIDLSSVSAVLDAYVLAYPSKVNIDMPDILLSISGVIELSFENGSNTETGSVDPGSGVNYSYSMALRASSQSSASLVPDVTPKIVQFWGNNLDCMHYQFFMSQPVTPSGILDRLTTITGSTVGGWPKFSPTSVTVTAKGMKASVQSTASSQGSAANTVCGTSCPSNPSTSAGGTGFSHERSLNMKTIRISPTIHAGFTLDGDHTKSQPISAFARANTPGLGPDSFHTEPDSVDAAIYIEAPLNYAVPASPGDAGWPTSGLLLYKLDAQPFKYGYIQFHAIVVDGGNFPKST